MKNLRRSFARNRSTACLQTRTSQGLTIDLAIVALLVGGCGDAVRDRPTARVSGTVSVAGAPVSQGRLIFMPDTGTPGQPATSSITAGHYEARVPHGRLRAVFHITDEIGPTVEIFGRKVRETTNQVPQARRGGVEIEISGDRTDLDFAL
jgi:hypothetical protein